MASAGFADQDACLDGHARPTSQRRQRPSAVGRREGPWAVQGLPRPQASFLHRCNIERSRRDSLTAVTIMSAFTVRALQHHATLPLSSLVLYAAALALTLAILPWSRRHPDNYARWRESLVAALRLLLASPPLAQFWAARGNALLWHLPVGGPLALLAFLLKLLSSSNSLSMAILGLGLPVRFGAHMAVQLAMQQLVRLGNKSTCQAVLAPTESLHADGVFAAAAAAAGMGSQQLVGWWYSAFSFLNGFLPPPWSPSFPQNQPMEQCLCLLEFFQLGLGLLLPIAMVLLAEARAYCAHSQCSRRRLSLEGGVGGRGSEVCFRQRLYLHACELVDGTLGVVKLWAAVSVLAVLWESAQVRGSM